MSDMNATLRTSLQAKLGRWATSMRKYIAARLIERRVVDIGMHQEKTTVTFYLSKTYPKCITGFDIFIDLTETDISSEEISRFLETDACQEAAEFLARKDPVTLRYRR